MIVLTATFPCCRRSQRQTPEPSHDTLPSGATSPPQPQNLIGRNLHPVQPGPRTNVSRRIQGIEAPAAISPERSRGDRAGELDHISFETCSDAGQEDDTGDNGSAYTDAFHDVSPNRAAVPLHVGESIISPLQNSLSVYVSRRIAPALLHNGRMSDIPYTSLHGSASSQSPSAARRSGHTESEGLPDSTG